MINLFKGEPLKFRRASRSFNPFSPRSGRVFIGGEGVIYPDCSDCPTRRQAGVRQVSQGLVP